MPEVENRRDQDSKAALRLISRKAAGYYIDSKFRSGFHRFRKSILDHEWQVEQQTGQQRDQLQPGDIPRPGREHIHDGGHGRLGVDPQVIAPQRQVDKKHDNHVYISVNKYALDRIPGWTITLDSGHVNPRGHQQAMRHESLDNAKMREAVNAHFRCK